LAILCKNQGPSITYKGFPTELNKPLPVIAVPSTTGTGSEVVYNASFIDEDTQTKLGINYKHNYPVLAVLDPLLPACAPIQVLASSGCDALVHALEAYMSNQSNQHSKLFSKHAYHLIITNMNHLLQGRGDNENWLNMQWSAVYAMFALSNSTSGPTAALSYYLGTHYKVNHGMAGAVFIGKICRYNHDNGFYGLGGLYDSTNRNKPDIKEKSAFVVQQIEDLLELAGVPKSLEGFGVKENEKENFNEFARKAKPAFDFNPISIEPARVAEQFVLI
jgi:alcohol dehydrogenase class IV